MVLGFAMCATFAFAQTAHRSLQDAKAFAKISKSDVMRSVDYKASIFSKDGGHDTMTTITFNTAITEGILTASDRIQDTTVGTFSAHGLTGSMNRWIRYSDTADFRSRANTNTPGLGDPTRWMTDHIIDAMNPANIGNAADDGFVVISVQEVSTNNGCYNAYVNLPAYTMTAADADAEMIEIALTQDYRKYYDQCFVDYKIGSNWYAAEINITGIDCGVNDFCAYQPRFTLPQVLASQSTIELRLRLYAEPITYTSGGQEFASYGYFWAVDNVAIMKNTNAYDWSVSGVTYFDGFYGMIPEGMNIPLSFGANVQNISTGDINNAHATVYASYDDPDNFTEIATGYNNNLTHGDPSHLYHVWVDERGMVDTSMGVDEMYYQLYSGYEHGVYGSTGIPTGFQGRSLPTDNPTTAGHVNLYTVTINSAAANLTQATDTMAYTVTTETPHSNTREGGYRWARDNGAITSHATPFRYAYHNGQIDNSDQDDHHTRGGYRVWMRYVTPSVIPTDNSGNPWVFRGVELIPSTRGVDVRENKMVGTQLVAEIYEEVGDEEGIGWQYIDAGTGIPHVVTANDINDTLGYILPGQNYKAINLSFPAQVTMKPNTAYLVGYVLNADAQFMLASPSIRYRDRTYTDSLFWLGRNADAYYYGQRTMAPANVIDIMTWDPIQGRWIYGWNIDYYAMIRPIVGPARDEEYLECVFTCHDNSAAGHQSHAYIETPTDSLVCGDVFDIVRGGAKDLLFVPTEENSVIDSVVINNVRLTVGDGADQMAAHEYNVESGDGENVEVLLYRNYYSYTLMAIDDNVDDYSIDIYTHWQALGIDPVAPEVSLKLAPNPATSTVKLNLTGVTGMVNCNIIDMSGRVVYEANINAEGEHIINVNNIPAGAYFVRVTNDTFSKIEKLIIK